MSCISCSRSSCFHLHLHLAFRLRFVRFGFCPESALRTGAFPEAGLPLFDAAVATGLAVDQARTFTVATRVAGLEVCAGGHAGVPLRIPVGRNLHSPRFFPSGTAMN